MKTWSDDMLVAACLKQDRKAQRALYEKYSARMMSLCLRYVPERQLAEDLHQEAFYRVFTKLEQYKGGSLEAWMRRLFAHAAINTYHRKFKADLKASVEYHDAEVQEETLSKLAAEDLHRLIAELPDGCRAVFNLYAVEGYTHGEVGALLGIDAGTSKSQYHRARQLLKQKLSVENPTAL